MTRLRLAYIEAAGLVGTIVAATLLPWAHYGGIDFTVGDMPNWEYYVSTAVALHLCVGLAVVARARRNRGWSAWLPRVTTLIVGAVSVAAAGVVLSRYRDAEALFGSIAPPIAPALGLGGPVAIAAIVISAGAVMIPRQHPASSQP